MSEEKIQELALKFLNDEASEQEVKLLLQWYNAFDDNEDVHIFTPNINEKEEIRERIRNRILFNVKQPLQSGRLTHKIIGYIGNYRLQAAAVLLLVMSAAALLYLAKTKPASQLVLITAAKKQLQKVTLPDHSVAWLNADTKLSYGKDFNKKTRQVFLDGEAYFDVTHNAAKPFIVKTAFSTTRVLGTAFDVRAYTNDAKVTVTVIRGRVQVQDQQLHTTIITPNQQAQVDVHAGLTENKNVSAEAYHSWTNGALSFNGESFEEISKVLSRKFDVQIRFENEAVSRCNIIATFEENDSLDKILTWLCKTNGSSFDRIAPDNAILITGKGCY